MTQNEQVLQHLQEHGSITALEAMEKYRIFRLAARIADLRAAGVLIGSEMVTVKHGKETVRFVKYSLEA